MNPEQIPEEGRISFNTSLGIAFVLGLLIGFIIGNMSAGKFAGGVNTIPNNSAVSTSTSVSASSTSSLSAEWVSVSDQPAGNSVTLATLSLDKNYWVAIRDHIESTTTPRVLGARKIFAGNYQNASIYVSRATVPGATYDVVLYNDSPDFDYSPSNLVMNGSDIVRASFKAQ